MSIRRVGRSGIDQVSPTSEPAAETVRLVVDGKCLRLRLVADCRYALPMNFTSADIRDFQAAWHFDFGETITPDQAIAEMRRLLTFFTILARALRSRELEPLERRRSI